MVDLMSLDPSFGKTTKQLFVAIESDRWSMTTDELELFARAGLLVHPICSSTLGLSLGGFVLDLLELKEKVKCNTSSDY
jgi:hypothetical protein